MKVKFTVFDVNGMDVTNKRNWLLDSNGDLFYETTDIDSTIEPVLDEEGFTYELD